MRAAFLKAPFQVDIRDLPEPDLGPTQLLLKPRLVGICGSDIQYARRFADDWQRFGHEPVAEVIAVGDMVEGVAPGDLVACQCSSACGYCRACLMGRAADCENRHLTRFLGYFAELVAVDRRNVWKLDGIPPRAAVLLEPMGMAFDIVRLAEIELESRVAVVGPGPIGLMAIRIAKLRGARRVYAVGVAADAARAQLCKDLGADEFINVDEDNAVEAIMDLTDGRGVNAVMNTATVRSLPDSLLMCAFGGKVVFMGESTLEGPEARPAPGVGGSGDVPLDANWIHLNKLQLRGSFAVPNGLLPLGHDLLADGVFPVDQVVSHIFPFEDLGEALERVQNRDDGIVKAAIAVTA